MKHPLFMNQQSPNQVAEDSTVRAPTRPSTCLADASEVDCGGASEFSRSIPSSFSGRLLPRKWWEWDFLASSAENLNLLQPSNTVLGLGVGTEPLIYYFARNCRRVIASDLYDASTAWKEARVSNLDNIKAASPIDFPASSLDVINADMRKVPMRDGSVDWIWSCSSIEHVPTLNDLISVFREIHRLLRPGGYALLTTEFCLNEQFYLLPGVNAWNSVMWQAFSDNIKGMSAVGPTNLRYNWLHPGNAARPRRYVPLSSLSFCDRALPYNYRAGVIANPVGLSTITPIGFCLQKTGKNFSLDWSHPVMPEYCHSYTKGVEQFLEGDNGGAIERLKAVYHDCPEAQLRQLAFRFMIDCEARQGALMDKHAFARRLKQHWASIADEVVHDADSLDIVGYLLGECGYYDEALEVYEACINSPSTSLDHLLELVDRCTALCAKAGRLREKAERIREAVLGDLAVLNGASKPVAQ